MVESTAQPVLHGITIYKPTVRQATLAFILRSQGLLRWDQGTLMAHELIYHFRYTADEVMSAYRLRFIHSLQLKVVAVVGFLAELFLIGQQLFPQALHRPAGSNWGAPVDAAIIIIGLPLLVYLIGPLLDYRTKPDWQKEYDMFLTKEAFRIEAATADKPGVPIKWYLFKRHIENDKVVVMFLNSERVFIIIPRRLFENQEQQAFFRNVLSKKVSNKTTK